MLLAADRVYLATHVTTGTGELLPHPFTMTAEAATYFLLHLPSDYSGHPLDGVLPCVQPGLSSRSTRCCQQLPVAPGGIIP